MARVELSNEWEHHTPKDLMWSLADLTDRQRAQAFLLAMSKYLPAYSPLTQQLYGDYDLAFTGDIAVAIPAPHGHLETFSNIPPGTVRRTGVQLIPNADGLSLVLPIQGGKRLAVDLKVGLCLLHKRIPGGFTPVIQKGDLRRYSTSCPALHLHALMTEKITSMSGFQQEDIRQLIQGRVSSLLEVGHQPCNQ